MQIFGIRRIIFNLLSLQREVSCVTLKMLNCFYRLNYPSFGSRKDFEYRWGNRFLIGYVIIRIIDDNKLRNYIRRWNSFEIII